MTAVGELRRQSGRRREVELEGPIEDLEVQGQRVDRDPPVRFSGVLESVHEGILVTGVVRARWTGTCRRCLSPAHGEIEVEVRELCVEHGDEETTYPLQGDWLDLEPIVHDACILELPLAPLCQPGCLGLCPTCGADRNREPCTCAPVSDPRWAGLAGWSGPQAGADEGRGRPTGTAGARRHRRRGDSRD